MSADFLAGISVGMFITVVLYVLADAFFGTWD